MPNTPRRPSEAELARAVRDLLLAEQDFTRAYGAWLRSRDLPERATELRAQLEVAEAHVDQAQREVIRRQPERPT